VGAALVPPVVAAGAAVVDEDLLSLPQLTAIRPTAQSAAAIR
jgi:hypothetical protein